MINIVPKVLKNYTLCFLLFLSTFCGINAPQTFAQNWEHKILTDLHTNRNTAYDPVGKAISFSVLPISIAWPVTEFGVGLLKKDKERLKNAALISLGLFANIGLTQALKYSFDRGRPYATYPDLDPVVFQNDPSFPSGHTSAAFHTATLISLHYPKWYVIAPASLWASSVGYSRMHLGVHYPTDILAGAITGAGTAFLSFKLNKWLMKRWK